MEDSERAEMEREDGRAIPLDPRTMRSFASPATPDAIAAKAVQSSRPSSPAHDIRRWAKAFDGALPGRVLLDMERECRGSERKFLGMALARAKESQSGCLRSADDFMAAMEARRSRGSHGQGGGRFDAIGLMIEAGAFPRAIDSEGNSILHFMAVANLGAELESALLAMGPRAARSELARRNVEGRAPAESAMAFGSLDAIQAMDRAWDSFPVNHERAAASKWFHAGSRPRMEAALALIERAILGMRPADPGAPAPKARL